MSDIEVRLRDVEKKIDIFKDRTAEKDIKIITSLTQIEAALEGFEKFEEAVKKQLSRKGAIAYGGGSAATFTVILELIKYVSK